jgi:hypothetical protein
MVKLLMSWDIQSGNEAEYFQFVIQEFVPGLLRLGLQPTEVWFTAYGDCPQIQAGGWRPIRAMDKIVHSPDWDELRQKLEAYVTGFHHKIIPAVGGFQL